MRMSEKEICTFELCRPGPLDDEFVCGSSWKYADQALLAAFVKNCRQNRSLFSGRFSDEELLDISGVTRGGKPTLAGILVFSEVPQLFFPGLSVVACAVPGDRIGDTGSQGERFTADRRIDGSLNVMLEDSLRFIRMNTANKVILHPDGSHSEQSEYPLTAVREAVLNALMHRDYSRHSLDKPVQITVFHNRMEITSPGSLHGTDSAKRLGKARLPLRNPTLAILLKMTGTAEHRYSGIPAIRRACLDAGIPEPEFVSADGEFTVIFRNRFSEDVQHSVPSPAAPSPELSDLQKEVLAFCTEPRTRTEIAQAMNLTASYLKTIALTPLLEAELLKMTLPEKPKSRFQKFYAEPGPKKHSSL